MALKGSGSSQARQFSAGLDRLMTYKNKYYGWETGKQVRDYLVSNAISDRVSSVFDQDGPRISDREFNRLSAEISRLWRVSSKEGDGLQILPWELGQALVAIESVKAGDYQGRTAAEARRESALALRLLPLFGSSTRYRALARLQASEQVIYGLAQTWQQSDGKTARIEPVKELTQGIDKVLTKLRVSRATARPLLVGLAAHSLVRTDTLGRSTQQEFDPRTLDLSADQKEFVKHFSLNRLEVLRQQHRQRFENDSSSWRYMHYETRRDPKEFKNLEERLAAWSALLKQPKPTLEGNVERYYRYQEARDAFVLVARRYGPNHPTTLAARKKMEEADGQTTGRGKYRADVLLTELELDKLMWKKLTPEEEAKRADLEKKRDELFARMGDPLLIVIAPKDASVSALLPDGRIVTLAWNSHALRWEHRFDLPPGSKEGEVKIPVWIRHAKGQTESREVRLHVDQTAPGLKVSWIETGKGWRLEVVTEPGVARVNLALTDGRRLVLGRVSATGGQVTWALEIEGSISGEAVVIATDSAHNRTEVRRSFSP